MKHSLKLKEQRASLVEELQKIVDLAEAEERDFNTEEEVRQGEIHTEVNTLDELKRLLQTVNDAVQEIKLILAKNQL